MSHQTSNSCSISERLAEWTARFNRGFDELLRAAPDAPPRLVEAMRYAALPGGKRLRPFLLTRFCELCGGSFDHALPAAAAVECVHTFSLVHDDLPAMDDDDVRRGRPTTHKVFGEALAILAGDALLALAFELVVGAKGERSAAMVLELARGTGWRGMIGGQVADLMGERQPPSRELASAIHTHKTADLFAASCKLGALAAGAGDESVETAAKYGMRFGLAFQVTDDLLDVTSTAEATGKSVRKDAATGKQTYPAIVGIEESRRIARRMAGEAVDALQSFGAEADDLRALAKFAVERQH